MIDPNIIKRCQLGEEAAYDELYKLVYKKALWTVYLTAGRMDIAEDVVQETFFECFRNINKLKRPELFLVWFNRILVRTCWHLVLSENKKAAKSLDGEILLELQTDNSDFEKIEDNDTNLLIRETIKRLNPQMRMTIILYYYNNLTVKEIAQTMNCFQGTVKSRLHYAKKTLERELKQDLSEDCFMVLGYKKKECILNGQK